MSTCRPTLWDHMLMWFTRWLQSFGRCVCFKEEWQMQKPMTQGSRLKATQGKPHHNCIATVKRTALCCYANVNPLVENMQMHSAYPPWIFRETSSALWISSVRNKRGYMNFHIPNNFEIFCERLNKYIVVPRKNVREFRRTRSN